MDEIKDITRGYPASSEKIIHTANEEADTPAKQVMSHQSLARDM